MPDRESPWEAHAPSYAFHKIHLLCYNNQSREKTPVIRALSRIGQLKLPARPEFPIKRTLYSHCRTATRISFVRCGSGSTASNKPGAATFVRKRTDERPLD